MSSSERIPLMKRSIFWLVILIMIAGATYIYEKDLFSNGLEAITVSTNGKKLPIYRVNTDKPMVALSLTLHGGMVKGASRIFPTCAFLHMKAKILQNLIFHSLILNFIQHNSLTFNSTSICFPFQ